MSEEYQQKLQVALKQEDEYYILKNDLYEVTNELKLLKTEFDAYKIMK